MQSQERSEILVHRAQSGDRGAFEGLVARYRDRLEALVRSRLAPHLRGELEDVLQETLLTGFSAVERFTWRGEESFLRWLGGIANHVILNLVRRHRTVTEPLGPDLAASDPSPSAGLRRDERFDRLQIALATLDADYRTVLELAHLEGLKTTEIAKRMHRSPQAVRQLIWRALRKLRGSFGDTESFGLPDRTLDERGSRENG